MTSIAFLGMMVLSASSLLDGEATLVSEGYKFSEGPVWIAGEGLVFSDVRGDTMYRGDGSEFRNPSNLANGLALDSEGRLIACESGLKRITRTESDGSIIVLADNFDGKGLNSTNDVVVRSDGGIYFTDPGATTKTVLSTNGVYRIDPETGALSELSTTARYPNGIGFSPDEKTLYVADFMGGLIRQYDVAADGSVSGERVFCDVKNPDGFALDEQGNLWTADRNGVAVFNRSGEQVEAFELPAKPTNCCFGGEDGKTLFVTARSAVYSIRTKVKGLGRF
ncbi:MAG: SMP-30/gluconolactonase/LRE family protein [Candidatus Hydrogenedentota bacterium]